MNSREALKEIRQDYDKEHQRENCLLDIIEKDLKVLEILKRSYIPLSSTTGFSLWFEIFEDDKGFKKVERWLKRND